MLSRSPNSSFLKCCIIYLHVLFAAASSVKESSSVKEAIKFQRAPVQKSLRLSPDTANFDLGEIPNTDAAQAPRRSTMLLASGSWTSQVTGSSSQKVTVVLVLLVISGVLFAFVAWDDCGGPPDQHSNVAECNQGESDLLLRCGMLSPRDFETPGVGQDHITECMRIASAMLKEKPPEHWVALSQESKQSFQEAITQIALSTGADEKMYGASMKSIIQATSKEQHNTVPGRNFSDRNPLKTCSSTGLPHKSPIPRLDCSPRNPTEDRHSDGLSPASPKETSEDYIFPSLLCAEQREHSDSEIYRSTPKISTAAPSDADSTVCNWSNAPSPNLDEFKLPEIPVGAEDKQEAVEAALKLATRRHDARTIHADVHSQEIIDYDMASGFEEIIDYDTAAPRPFVQPSGFEEQRAETERLANQLRNALDIHKEEASSNATLETVRADANKLYENAKRMLDEQKDHEMSEQNSPIQTKEFIQHHKRGIDSAKRFLQELGMQKDKMDTAKKQIGEEAEWESTRSEIMQKEAELRLRLEVARDIEREDLERNRHIPFHPLSTVTEGSELERGISPLSSSSDISVVNIPPQGSDVNRRLEDAL